VGDELIAGVAQLVGVAVASEIKSTLDRGSVDRGSDQHGATGTVAVRARRRVELLDNGEEIGEKLAAIYD
jgi:hypothetical protein